jgi:hypothetical protein
MPLANRKGAVSGEEFASRNHLANSNQFTLRAWIKFSAPVAL